MSNTPNISLIAQNLNCSEPQITLEEWKYVYFVKVLGKRPTFVSKKKFSITSPDEPIVRLHGADFLSQLQTVDFKSSCLSSGTYSKDSNTLSLKFCNGNSYEYYNVPSLIWVEITKSYVSPGRAYNQLIKGKYRGCKVA